MLFELDSQNWILATIENGKYKIVISVYGNAQDRFYDDFETAKNQFIRLSDNLIDLSRFSQLISK